MGPALPSRRVPEGWDSPSDASTDPTRPGRGKSLPSRPVTIRPLVAAVAAAYLVVAALPCLPASAASPPASPAVSQSRADAETGPVIASSCHCGCRKTGGPAAGWSRVAPAPPPVVDAPPPARATIPGLPARAPRLPRAPVFAIDPVPI